MYFKMLKSVPAIEILMHRVIWSVVVLWVLLLISRNFNRVYIAAREPKILIMLLISGLLLACNWLLFIWAVNNDHLLEASLGYYINPLFNVLLAKMFLQESLNKLQKLAVWVAMLGVTVLVLSYGQIPWIALALAISFSIYGLLRKKVAVDSMPGLFIESSMMLPFALIYWLIAQPSSGNFFVNSFELNISLVLLGVVTTAPLLCFTAAAKRIRYTTLGFFQYIGPSIMFLLAVMLYKEPLDVPRVLTFVCVWLALLIYVFDSVQTFKRSKSIVKGS